MGHTKKKKDTGITWNHCESVPPARLLVKCKYCSYTCWGGIARMKHHLAEIKENVIACIKVPNEVKEMFLKILEDKEKMKEANKQDCFEEVSTQDNTKKGTLESFAKKGKQGTMKQQTMAGMLKDREPVNADICKCIYVEIWKSPSGTVFLKSVDTSNVIKDANHMFELLDSMVEEIGEDNVMQVVTDGASNFVKAGKMLENKRTKLFWSPCATHCLDLILEDNGQLLVFYNTIANAKKVTTFIYRHPWVLNLYRKHSKGRELARPVITRFATAFLTLQCISQQKNALRSMFASEILEIYPLLLEVCDSKPLMLYIYEAVYRAKEQIAANFKNQESRYKKKIIDTHWDLQLHSNLHAASFYLNPKFDNAKNYDPDTEVLMGLYETIEKMIPDRRTRFLVDQQLDRFRTAKGLFGMSMAIDTRNEATCAMGHGRNWSIFDQVHTKRRNHLEQQRLNALIFVKTFNLR
uniref:DUF659 domain-containing protein n=1 Tax=Glycine max TaxID=3847 RepID=A0A0R0FNV4_SOYBN